MITTSGAVLTSARSERDVGASAVQPVLLVCWIALFLNVLAFTALPTVLPIPGSIGQLITQGSLALSLLLALVANRKGVLRPNWFLTILTVMAIGALTVSIHNQFLLGSTFRASRFLVFLTVLWLLSPWFGRRDMVLLRYHRNCLTTVMVVVAMGVPLSPGLAFSYGGRLSGIIWPMPPTQVAHYAAVVLGTSALLWMCQVISGKSAVLWIVLSTAVLVGTHTRTALIACLVALTCAGASLFLGNKRVRRTSLWGVVVVLGTVAAFANEIVKWALRGQSSQEAGGLTGRTDVWSEVIHAPRSIASDIFGSGMSNLSWNGLAIDSNWVATYLDGGWFAVVLDAALFIVMLVVCVTGERTPQRAIALFLIVYCLFASITETGMSNPSPYLLDLAVAASLLLPRRGASS